MMADQEIKQPFNECSHEERQCYAEKAKALILKGYPVPTNDVYQLAEIMYNKQNEQSRNT